MSAPPVRVTILVCLVFASLLAGTGVVLAGGFSISASGTITTPTETVSVEGHQFTVNSVKQVDPGEPIDVQVSAPDGADYIVELYNSNEQVEDVIRGTGGGGTYTFPDTDAYGVGSYVATVYADGVHEDIQPVIVAGYDVSLSYPSEFELDGTDLEVEVTLTPTAASGAPANDGEVALWRDGQTIRAPATHVEGDTYLATVDADELSEGSYWLYAGAQGGMTSEGEYEVLAASNRQTLEVVEAEEPNNDSGGFVPPDDDSDGVDDDNGEDEVDGDDTGDETADDDSDAETTDDDVNESTDEVQLPSDTFGDDDAEADDDGIPAVAPWVAGIAILTAILLYRRR